MTITIIRVSDITFTTAGDIATAGLAVIAITGTGAVPAIAITAPTGAGTTHHIDIATSAPIIATTAGPNVDIGTATSIVTVVEIVPTAIAGAQGQSATGAASDRKGANVLRATTGASVDPIGGGTVADPIEAGGWKAGESLAPNPHAPAGGGGSPLRSRSE